MSAVAGEGWLRRDAVTQSWVGFGCLHCGSVRLKGGLLGGAVLGLGAGGRGSGGCKVHGSLARALDWTWDPLIRDTSYSPVITLKKLTGKVEELLIG
ncbi:hypothetical protein QQ045_021763 [Rhodiola kirilowii]